jgi:malonyl CoA-acyl carrier protein transacylase
VLEIARRCSGFESQPTHFSSVGIDEMTCDRVIGELTSAGREIFVSIINSRHQIVVMGKIEDVDAALGI